MIRILVAGVWICIVTLVAAYLAVSASASKQSGTGEHGDEFFGGLDYAKTEIISVPVIEEGKIQGYVIAQFVYTVDVKAKKKLSVPPDIFINDSAFRNIYVSTKLNFDAMEKADLDALTESIKGDVNERFHKEVVKDILVEIYNFVPKDDITRNPLRTKLQHQN